MTAMEVAAKPRRGKLKAANPIDGYVPHKGPRLVIKAPNFEVAAFKIVGTSELVQHRFSAKAMQQMRDKQSKGDAATRGRKELREAKDFGKLYEQARHISHEGWDGITCSSFRKSMIRVCSLVGIHMTMAKMSIFVLADGRSNPDNQALVKITKGKPFKFEATVRNQNGTADIRARPMWNAGWEAVVRIRYDADQFTAADVGNLLHRAGQQSGVGEGRASSKKSDGCGWGSWVVKGGAT